MESLESIQTYYNFYLKNKSINKTSKQFHKCAKQLKKAFVHYGLKYPLEDFNKKYNYNQDYFDVIDTEAKAYFLGFIFADGGIHVRQRKNSTRLEKSLKINLLEKDKEILEMLKQELQYSGPISILKGKQFISPTNNQVYIRGTQACLYISSTKLVDSLMSYGLGNRKTYMELSMPNIPEDLIKHFLRGYFDGDGCSHKNMIAITSKTKTLLSEIQNYFQNKCNLPFGDIRLTKRNVFIWTFTKESKMFLEYLYKDANFYLSRKNPHDQLKSRELLETPEEDNQQPSFLEIG